MKTKLKPITKYIKGTIQAALSIGTFLHTWYAGILVAILIAIIHHHINKEGYKNQNSGEDVFYIIIIVFSMFFVAGWADYVPYSM